MGLHRYNKAEMTKVRSGSMSVLQSMLHKIKGNESTAQDSQSKDPDQNEWFNNIHEYDKREGNTTRGDYSESSVNPGKKNRKTKIRYHSDVDVRYFAQKADAELSTTSHTVFPKWERRRGVPRYQAKDSHLKKGKAGDKSYLKQGTSHTHFKGLNDTPVHNESSVYNQKEHLLPTSEVGAVKGTTVSEDNGFKTKPRAAPIKSLRFQLEEQDSDLDLDQDTTNEVEDLSDIDDHMAKNSYDSRLLCRAQDNSKIRRSQSAPETVKKPTHYITPRSDPFTDCVADRNDGVQKQTNKFPRQESTGDMTDPEESESTYSKTIASEYAEELAPKKGKKGNKMKIITHKWMNKRTKDKKNQDQDTSSSSQYSKEEETQSVSSGEEVKPVVIEQPSPTLFPDEEPLTPVHLNLRRTFTIRDFKLNLEPINLLEEILVGEEWASFLRPKDCPPQTEADNLPPTDSNPNPSGVDGQCYVVDIKQEGSSDEEDTQLEGDQVTTTASDTPRRRKTRQNSIIIAVPKSLITNGAVKQRKPVPKYELPEPNDDVYDFVEIYMLPKKDPPNDKNSKDQTLNFSVVKSSGLLDNSALKSRIQLSRKRKHRPPNKRKKGKSEVKQNARVFKLPWTSVDPVQQSDVPTKSSTSLQSIPACSVISKSRFYTFPKPSSSFSEDSEDVSGLQTLV